MIKNLFFPKKTLILHPVLLRQGNKVNKKININSDVQDL